MWNIELNVALDFVMSYTFISESSSLKLRSKIYFSTTYFMKLKTIDHCVVITLDIIYLFIMYTVQTYTYTAA